MTARGGADVLTDLGTILTGEWFTYRQAAELLSVSTEAVRQRAKRGQWQKTLGNDKRTRIRPPEGWNDVVRTSDSRALRARVVDERALANHVIRALEAHVETLKTQLAAAELRAEKQAVEFAARKVAPRRRSRRRTDFGRPHVGQGRPDDRRPCSRTGAARGGRKEALPPGSRAGGSSAGPAMRDQARSLHRNPPGRTTQHHIEKPWRSRG